jgi:hypothetical protein
MRPQSISLPNVTILRQPEISLLLDSVYLTIVIPVIKEAQFNGLTIWFLVEQKRRRKRGLESYSLSGG